MIKYDKWESCVKILVYKGGIAKPFAFYLCSCLPKCLISFSYKLTLKCQMSNVRPHLNEEQLPLNTNWRALLQKHEAWQSILQNTCHFNWQPALINDLLQVSLICGYVFFSKALFQFNNRYHNSYENCLIMRGVTLGNNFCLQYFARNAWT